MTDGEQWRSRARGLLCCYGWDAMASREGENCSGEWRLESGLPFVEAGNAEDAPTMRDVGVGRRLHLDRERGAGGWGRD
jgi:hypothetical protein